MYLCCKGFVEIYLLFNFMSKGLLYCIAWIPSAWYVTSRKVKRFEFENSWFEIGYLYEKPRVPASVAIIAIDK